MQMGWPSLHVDAPGLTCVVSSPVFWISMIFSSSCRHKTTGQRRCGNWKDFLVPGQRGPHVGNHCLPSTKCQAGFAEAMHAPRDRGTVQRH
jgi:hypothetical protein